MDKESFCNFTPQEITLLATSIAINISSGKDSEEIFVLRNIFNQITNSLSSIHSQSIYCEKHCNLKKDKNENEFDKK